MWKKINNHEVIGDVKPGDIITTNPGHSEVEYVIQKIYIDHVKVIHTNSMYPEKLFSGEELLSGTWWVKA